MKSFALLSFIAYAVAQSGTCPNPGAPIQLSGGSSVCCPSGMIDTNNNITYCVINCQRGFEPCFPFCTADGTTNSQTTSGVCTSVPATATDFSAQVAGATAGSGTATNTASSQTTGSATGAMQSSSAQTGSTTSMATQTSSSATTSSTSSSVKNAGAMMTAAPLLMIGALAGVVIV